MVQHCLVYLSLFCGIPAAAWTSVAVVAVQLVGQPSLQAGFPCGPAAPASPALLGREPLQPLPLPRSLAQPHCFAAAQHKLIFCARVAPMYLSAIAYTPFYEILLEPFLGLVHTGLLVCRLAAVVQACSSC